MKERLAWIRTTLMSLVLGRNPPLQDVAIELSNFDRLTSRVDEWLALERQSCWGIGWERVEAGVHAD